MSEEGKSLEIKNIKRGKGRRIDKRKEDNERGRGS